MWFFRRWFARSEMVEVLGGVGECWRWSAGWSYATGWAWFLRLEWGGRTQWTCLEWKRCLAAERNWSQALPKRRDAASSAPVSALNQ